MKRFEFSVRELWSLHAPGALLRAFALALTFSALVSLCIPSPSQARPRTLSFMSSSAGQTADRAVAQTVAERSMRLLHRDLGRVDGQAPIASSVDEREIEAQVAEAIRLSAAMAAPPLSFDLVGYVASYMGSLTAITQAQGSESLVKSYKAAPLSQAAYWDSVLLVDQALHEDLEDEFTAWANTILAREGRRVAVVPVPQIQIDPALVRAAIKYLYDTYAVKGVILAGQWPVAFWACTIPDHPDWTHVGPLWAFYTDLDEGLFSLVEGDPAAEGVPFAYNRYHRDALEYPHDNISVTTGEAFAYGPELWVLHWRATAVHSPMSEDDLVTEREQIRRFMAKSVAYHRRQAPYWQGGRFLQPSIVGMCHEDYAWNCDASVSNSTAAYVAGLGVGPYYNSPRLGGEAFVPSLRQNEYRHLAFDVWTHSGPQRFWPSYLPPRVRDVGADELLWDSEWGSGFLMTFIFGCSSGVFTEPELSGGVNYALSFIMGAGIDLVSIGTPWSIGFGSPYKAIMYGAMIDLHLSSGQGMVIAGAESAYQSLRWAEAVGVDPELSIAPYLYFGDPYVRLPVFDTIEEN